MVGIYLVVFASTRDPLRIKHAQAHEPLRIDMTETTKTKERKKEFNSLSDNRQSSFLFFVFCFLLFVFCFFETEKHNTYSVKVRTHCELLQSVISHSFNVPSVELHTRN